MIKKSLFLKTIMLTILFLVGLFFLFPPEQPLDHTHDRLQEPSTIANNTTIKGIPSDEDAEIDDFFSELELTNKEDHQSSLNPEDMANRLEKICLYYKDICDKIVWDSPYTQQERYVYTLLIVYNIKTIDSKRTLPSPNTLRNTISSIKMFESDEGRRGSAGTTHVKMNTQKIDSYNEFWEVFTHEVGGGHILDLGVITDSYSTSLHPEYTEFGEPKFGLNDWSLKFYKISRLDENTRRSDASYKDFVSGYAMKDTFEELAEFGNAWINHHDLLLELGKNNKKMQEKIDLFEELFGDRYFFADQQTLPKFDANERVFDSTKPWENKK